MYNNLVMVFYKKKERVIMKNKYDFAMNVALFRTLKIGSCTNEAVCRSEMSFLVYMLYAKREVTSIELSHYFSCSKVFVSKIINQLLEKKLVEKLDNKDDRRSFLITVTEKGRKLTTDYVEGYVKETDFLYEKLGEEKAQQFKELLEESREILKSYGK